MTKEPQISAIVPVTYRFDESNGLAADYLQSLESICENFELVFVLDGEHSDLEKNLAELAKADSRLRIIRLSKRFGEATALSAGIEATTGDIVLTLPAYYQVETTELGLILDALDDADMVIANRWPRAAASKFEVMRRKAFHWIIRKVAGDSFNDLGCGVRAFRRYVSVEIPIYGDQHRFLPLLAVRRGFRVTEVKVAQSGLDKTSPDYGPKEYVRRALDIVTVIFLVRFTKKPLRFFGMIGSVTFLLGVLFLGVIVVERLFFGVGMANRPAMLLSSLFIVLGLQIFALGLLGELIIFTHAREIKEYTIEEIVN